MKGDRPAETEPTPAGGLAERPVDHHTLDPLRDRLRARLFGQSRVPARVGRYLILRELGRGGMGRVYAAYDEQLDRKVAIKVLRRERAGDARHQQRLLREAQALARLSHPHVVHVYEVGEVEQRVFLVMELVAGRTLRAWQAQGPHPWREVLDHYLRAGQGLAAAHQAGLVHRDFKPDNVLVGEDGQVRVADFGLALAEGEVAISELDDDERDQLGLDDGLEPSMLGQRITRTGARVGTLVYMAPEQARGEPATAQSDQFSFCVSLFEALFGARPFSGRTAPELVTAIRQGPSRPPGHPVLPRWLLELVQRGLAPEPGDRFPDMPALLEAAARRLARRRRRGAMIIAAGVMTAGVLVRPTTASPCEHAAEELEAAWGERQREDIHAAFAATGLPYASGAARRTTAALERYADDWRAARVHACEATHVRHVQSSEALDLRAACLDRGRRELVALVGALTRADATAVERGTEATSSLPRLELCEDLERLRQGVAPAPPEQQAAVNELREALAGARSVYRLGDYASAARLLEPALERAREVGYAPLLAEALLVQGTVMGNRGELADAERVLLEAVDLAEAHRHDPAAAEVWSALGYLATRRLQDPARGRRWIRRGWAALRRIGSPALDASHLHEQQGHLHVMLRQFDHAERSYREALRLREQVLGAAHRGAIAARASLASTAFERGAIERALAQYEEVVAMLTEQLGPEHPEVGQQRFNLARAQLTTGALDAAAENLDATLAIYRRAYGGDSRRLAHVLLARAQVEDRRGEVDGALALAEQARERLVDAAQRSDPMLISTLDQIGVLHFRRRRWEEALDAFSRAAELTRAAPEPDPVKVAIGHSNIADALLALERTAEARARYEQALALMDEHLPAGHELRAYPLQGLGQAALERAEPAVALEPLREALAIRQAHPGDQPGLATTRWALARALAEPDPAEAVALARAARDLFTALGDRKSAAEIDTWLRDRGATL